MQSTLSSMHLRACLAAVLVAATSARPSGPSWKGIKAPTGDDRHKVQTSTSANYSSQPNYDVPYTLLARSGDKFGTATMGMIIDIDGKDIEVSNNPDFTSILQANGKLYSVTHFEQPSPGVAYFSELEQDAKGKLSIKTTAPLDFSKMGGLWIPCAGSVSPWGSHLGSEEYEPDARAFEAPANADKSFSTIKGLDYGTSGHMRFFKSNADTPASAKTAGFNPYMYGYAWETKISSEGKPITDKLWALGRQSYELIKVMPDQTTSYATDDGTDVIFTKFVADKRGDFSSGKLSCARFIQQSLPGGSASKFYAIVSWISMGSAKAADIKESLTNLNGTKVGAKFKDLFSVGTITPDGKGCVEKDFRLTKAGGLDAECLKVKKGFEAIASRLEKRRYAAYLGCTTEFRKWEGITYDPINHVLYTAISEVAKGMEGGSIPNDHINVKKESCGCVMRMGFNSKEDYSVAWITSELCGKAINATLFPELAKDNKCDLDGIASPDNVAMIPEYNQLIIGEDTSGHQNDVLWVKDFKTGKLTRIASTPYGSETTGPYWYPNVNGHSYITYVVQVCTPIAVLRICRYLNVSLVPISKDSGFESLILTHFSNL